jgi:hypothetical protein
MTIKTTLPTDSAARKRFPLARGPLAYAPAAWAGMARICINGNDKHNPGQELHHARGKSADHPDCIVRHLMDVQDIVADFQRRAETPSPADLDQLREEIDQLMWRAACFTQEIHERYLGAPLAPGARLPVAETVFIHCNERTVLGVLPPCCRKLGHEGDHQNSVGTTWAQS